MSTTTPWPSHDTARCVTNGEHIATQRHPKVDCPVAAQDEATSDGGF